MHLPEVTEAAEAGAAAPTAALDHLHGVVHFARADAELVGLPGSCTALPVRVHHARATAFTAPTPPSQDPSVHTWPDRPHLRYGRARGGAYGGDVAPMDADPGGHQFELSRRALERTRNSPTNSPWSIPRIAPTRRCSSPS